MIQIAICDNSTLDRQILKQMLECYFSKCCRPFTIQEYKSGSALENDYADGPALYQLIFLDILLPNSNGLNIAKTIRKYDTDVKIIFFTSSVDYVINSYDVYAFHYLIKPVKAQKLFKVLDRFIFSFDKNHPQGLFVKTGRYVKRIPYQDILYAESQNSYVIIHTSSNEHLRIYLKLDKIEGALDAPPFIRCHRSYIVNSNYIRTVHRSFILEDGTEIPIRRQDFKKIKEQYFDYVAKTAI